MAFLERYCSLLKRGRFVVFSVWLAIVLLGTKFAPLFTGATTAQYTSAKSSPSNVAQRRMASSFPATKHGVSLSVLLTWKEDGGLASPEEFLAAIKPVELELYDKVAEKYHYTFNSNSGGTGFIRSMQSYWLFEHYYGAAELGQTLISADGGSAIVSVTYDNQASGGKVSAMVDWLLCHMGLY